MYKYLKRYYEKNQTNIFLIPQRTKIEQGDKWGQYKEVLKLEVKNEQTALRQLYFQ